MATSFSPTPTLPSVRSSIFPQNPPKPLLSLPEFFRGGSNSSCVKRSWASSSSYVTLKLSNAFRVSARPLLSKGALLNRRMGIVRAATIEEIEAEKAAIEKDVKIRMERSIENVRANFNSIRTGRANPAMLDKIEVEYYGSPVSLKSIAQISTPDASSLLVQPYDKSSLKAIEKAIVSSDVGMTPNNDGEVIRLTLPQLTSERRKVFSISSSFLNEIPYHSPFLMRIIPFFFNFLFPQVALRNIRRDALKAYEKLEKEKKLSEDNVKDLSSDLQKLTDEYMKKVDTIFKQKEKELLTV
ncbi:ribosome-recycling factor, chloroplastic [Arachis stenosperma]|uniref:ribosome-recycling factor, chloroplastic n=1 Tax=Arachis stenosperma TaxID=217475 RepID=UPI0025ACA091|nr:ribosome-recycling factor, chloroplastic [Arachis stenosperma]